ncbi:MAG: hypothetical protein IPJ49_20105 [Candidatus Obscuribacter sp.]|nr:hypothetical protein [Candidatus Obscuribacter sp.]
MRDEAVVESSGKAVVNESVASHAPVVSARVAPGNLNTASPAVTPLLSVPVLLTVDLSLWRGQLSMAVIIIALQLSLLIS